MIPLLRPLTIPGDYDFKVFKVVYFIKKTKFSSLHYLKLRWVFFPVQVYFERKQTIYSVFSLMMRNITN